MRRLSDFRRQNNTIQKCSRFQSFAAAVIFKVSLFCDYSLKQAQFLNFQRKDFDTTNLALKVLFLIGSNITGLALLLPNAQARSHFPESLSLLLKALHQVDYEVRLSSPPTRGAYGEIDTQRKVIWIEPITIDLGIVHQTLIHESVHAAQACPAGKPSLVGWNLPTSRVVDLEISGILYRNYHRQNFDLEREAFAMQGHPNAVDLVTKELIKRCRQ